MLLLQHQATLPSKAARGRRPRAEELTEQHDTPQVVCIMSSQAEELVLHRHDTNGLARARGTSNAPGEFCGLHGNRSSLGGAVEKSPTERRPGLASRLLPGRKRIAGLLRVSRLHTRNPIQRDLLPERQMPKFLVNGVRRSRDDAVNQVFGKRLQDVGRSRMGTLRHQSCMRRASPP
jgi:hypothetical protein